MPNAQFASKACKKRRQQTVSNRLLAPINLPQDRQNASVLKQVQTQNFKLY